MYSSSFFLSPHYFYVKSQVDRRILLEGTVNSQGLYVFHNFVTVPSLPSAAAASVPSLPSCLSVAANSCNSFSNVNSSSASSITCNRVPHSYYLLHCRLGHASESSVKQILRQCNLPSVNKTGLDLFVACCLGNSHHLPPISQLQYMGYHLNFCFLIYGV